MLLCDLSDDTFTLALATPFHTALLEYHFLDLVPRLQLDLLGFARFFSVLRQALRKMNGSAVFKGIRMRQINVYQAHLLNISCQWKLAQDQLYVL